MVYPEKIRKKIAKPQHQRSLAAANAAATAANFSCGSFVRFSLLIDEEGRFVADVSFLSNGCGFMIAAANVLAESVTGKSLSDLHGLTDADLNTHIQTSLDEFPRERRECSNTCIEALRAAFADHRDRLVEEFRGEKALICTCFGVSEEAIEALIAKGLATTIEDIGLKCNAGSGCGSCRMLIQEMLDASI